MRVIDETGWTETTVGDLIDALSELPEDAPVLEAWAGGRAPLSEHTLQVWRHRDEVALYIVDGSAAHPDLEQDWEPLLDVEFLRANGD